MTESKNITLEDVRSVIASNELHLSNTNANKIRGFLGRGSLATIQKHLDALRNEKKEGLTPDTVKIDFNLIKTAIEQAAGLAVADVVSKADADVQETTEKLVTSISERDTALQVADKALLEKEAALAECKTLKSELDAKNNALAEMQKMFEKMVAAQVAKTAKTEKK